MRALNKREWSVDEFHSEAIKKIREDLENDKFYPSTKPSESDPTHPLGKHRPQTDEAYTPHQKKCFHKLGFKGMGNCQEDIIENIGIAGTCGWDTTRVTVYPVENSTGSRQGQMPAVDQGTSWNWKVGHYEKGS